MSQTPQKSGSLGNVADSQSNSRTGSLDSTGHEDIKVHGQTSMFIENIENFDSFQDRKSEDSQSSYEGITSERRGTISNFISTEEGIIYVRDSMKIHGGTLYKLVEKLTSAEYSDANYMQQFMLTYRSFTTSHQLLEVLVARDEDEKKSLLIRLRVFIVLKLWVEKHWVDFAEDNALTDEIHEFAAAVKSTKGNPASVILAAEQLVKSINLQAQGFQKKLNLTFNQPPPTPFVLPYSHYKKKTTKANLKMSMTAEHTTIMDYHPIEIARQLTITEYDLYKVIKPWEFFGNSWAKKDRNIKSNNVLTFIQRFNHVGNWVASEVLKVDDIKARALLIGRFIKIAKICESQLNNFNLTMEILAGLSAASVTRLKQTWATLAQIAPKKAKLHEELSLCMENNFKLIRDKLHHIQPPCVPYLGTYLSDLTFIEDGNPDLLENGYINFSKRSMMANAIQEIMQWQYTPYHLEKVVPISEALEKLISGLKWDEETMFQRSLKIEPKKSRGAPDKNRVYKEDKDKRRQSFIESQLESSKVESDELYGILQSGSTYEFSGMDDSSNIVLTKSNMIISATLKKLIERLTYYKQDPIDRNHKVNCNHCKTKIVGTRYQCLMCGSNYNQCESCANKPFHKMNHVFIKLSIPYNHFTFKPMDENDVVESMEQVHAGTCCTACGQSPIKGIRFKSLTSNDDLCAQCEKLHTPLDDVTVVFARIQKPLSESADLPKLSTMIPQSIVAKRDRFMLEAFLLTYRNFSDPNSLLNLLIKRYSIPLLALPSFERLIIKPIKMRVLKVLEVWVSTYWNLDFKENSTLQSQLRDFVTNQTRTEVESDVQRLAMILERKLKGKEISTPKKEASAPTKRPVGLVDLSKKAPVKAPNSEPASILDFSPKDIANNLTLLEFGLFKSLDTIDYLKHIQENIYGKSLLIETMVKKSNQTINWVVTEVLKPGTNNSELQSKIVSLFLEVAKICHAENNMNTTSEILSALEMDVIKSLPPAWSMVPLNLIEDYEKMKISVDKIKKRERDPCLPNIRKVLEDLTQLELLPSQISEMINFEKFFKIAEKIIQTSEFATIPYLHQPNPVIRNYLVKAFEETMDNEKMALISKQILSDWQKFVAANQALQHQNPPTLSKRSANIFKALKGVVSSKSSKDAKQFDDLESKSTKELISIIRKLEEQLKSEKEAREKAEVKLSDILSELSK